MRVRQLWWRVYLAAVAFAMCGLCLWPVVLAFTCYAPVPSAAETARRAAAEAGYRMGGYLGDILAEPDAAGGCTVQFEFLDLSTDPPQRRVTIRLERRWALGGWAVVEMREEPCREGPAGEPRPPQREQQR